VQIQPNISEKSTPVVVVTGAAGGIGKHVLLQLQGRARILAIVQNAAQQSEVAALSAHSVACDLNDAASVQRALDEIRASCPEGIDGLVFTAAIQPVGPLELISRQDLERLFAVNVFGTIQVVQGLIPGLRRRRGRIVIFSSMAGRVAIPVLGAYNGGKFALEGISDTLRRELLPSGISVSLIEPGGVETPMAAAQGPLVEQLLARLDAQSEQHYGRLIRGYLAMAKAGLRHASKPEAVAQLAVATILRRDTPRARYVAGRDAKLMIFMSRWLPTRWLDAMLVKLVLGKNS